LLCGFLLALFVWAFLTGVDLVLGGSISFVAGFFAEGRLATVFSDRFFVAAFLLVFFFFALLLFDNFLAITSFLKPDPNMPTF